MLKLLMIMMAYILAVHLGDIAIECAEQGETVMQIVCNIGMCLWLLDMWLIIKSPVIHR